ncbi:hypothetical protein PM082_006442 [Marasmius tenuissimus]|nr:hypothetical protein PM082_006442 [Marasmius tenuissimus]
MITGFPQPLPNPSIFLTGKLLYSQHILSDLRYRFTAFPSPSALESNCTLQEDIQFLGWPAFFKYNAPLRLRDGILLL